MAEEGDAEPEAAAPVDQAYAEPLAARFADIDPIKTASVPKEGWSIQVASSPSEVEARAFRPRTTRQAGAALADASPYTVTFDKGGVTYYRARFGGFEYQERRLERLQGAEEEEDRVLRRPVVGAIEELRKCTVSKENYP